jgi:hypothetical protein
MTDPSKLTELLALWSHRQRCNQKAHYFMSEKLGQNAFWSGVITALFSGAVGLLLILKARFNMPDSIVQVAAGVSILSSVIGTIVTSAKWSEKASQHHAAGAAYGAALRRIQQTLAVPPSSQEDLQKALTEIREAIDAIPSTAPGIPTKIWKKVPKELTPDNDTKQNG